MVKVSVIVPVYNVEKYLKKCLESLINQSLKDIEIIIVNDGSPDNSEEIILNYQKKYKNIKYLKKENGGLSDARNYGLKYATGDYISFIDSDDYIDKYMLEKMYNKALKNNLDIVICDSIEVYDEKEVHKKSNYHYSNNDTKNYIISPPMVCIRLFKKNLLNYLKFKKGIYYEDLNLTPSMAKYTNKIGFIEEGLYYYVQRDNSIMKQKKFNKNLLDIFEVLEHNKKLLEKDYKDEVEYLYLQHLLRTASLRFLDYKESKELLKKVNTTIRNYYPNYKNNIYYKKSSYKFKLICLLSYHKLYILLKIIKKVCDK